MDNNQSRLNAVPLSVASAMISNELIKARGELEETRTKLANDKKAYEEAYVLANDGDSSENAPLEAAIQNLKLVTGEIGNNARVLQIMEGLEDVQYLVGTYDFSDVKYNLEVANEDTKKELLKITGASQIEEIVNVLKASQPEDLLGWITDFEKFVNYAGNDQVDVELLRALTEFYKVASLPPYNTCGIVVLYSTVRLEMNGDLYTYRIYPEGVSFIDIGVMAADSRVARVLLGKEVGAEVGIQHTSNSKVLTYKIVDIY